MATNNIAYFGYGSLVNAETRPSHTRTIPLTLSGWTRQWKHCVEASFGKVCALTAARRPGAEIAGLLILDRTDRISEVDRREVGYRREPIEVDQTRLENDWRGIESFIYVSTESCYRWGDQEYPILRTYVDCVIAGFLRTFGRSGAASFVASTEGWHCPILDDRDAPRYPRAVKLSLAEKETIDELLAAKHSNLMSVP